MNRKNILIALGVIVLLGGAVVAANLWLQEGHRRRPSRSKRSRRAISKRSSRPRARFSRSAWSTSAPTRRAASSTSRSTKATGSRRASSCCRSTRSRCARASTAARRRCRRPKARSISCGSRSRPRACSSIRRRRPLTRQQDLWNQQLTTRESLEKAENDVRGAESALHEREKTGQLAGGAHQAGARRSRERALRPEQGPHRVADRRHRHAPQHPGGRNRGHRHDEQRRHGAADARRHVGDSGGSRSRRNEHPERHARPAGEDHDRRAARQDVQGPRHRDRQQPDSGDRHAGRVDARRPTSRSWSCIDEQIPDVRPGFTCTADITTATRTNVAAVPIPAVAVRELVYDANGQVVKAPHDPNAARGAGVEPVAVAAELKPGQTRKETEGVFVVAQRHGRSSCRSRSASPATSTSRCSTASSRATRSSPARTTPSARMTDGDPVKVDAEEPVGGLEQVGQCRSAIRRHTARHDQDLA